LEFLKYWFSSRDFNKLVIKAKMHANIYFWNFLCYMKIQYDFFLRDLAVCMKTKHFILFFLRNPSILILDLYFYSIKIQINISKCNKIFVENHIFFKRIFLRIFSGLGPTRPMRPGWTQLVFIRKRAWTIHAHLLAGCYSHGVINF
jgi:hypothetical protein